jgi:hypothetical protein
MQTLLMIPVLGKAGKVKSPTNSQHHEQASATFANPTVSIDFPMREIFAYAVWDDTMRSPILDLTKIRNTNPRMHLPQISALARPTHVTRPLTKSRNTNL